MGILNYHKKRRRINLSVGPNHHYGKYVKRRHPRYENEDAKKRRWKIAAIVLMVFLTLAGTGVGGFYYLRYSGEKSLKNAAQAEAPVIGDEKGLIYRDGKKYRFNEEIITLLMMGIDTETDLSEVKEVSGSSGQADTIFLAVLDPIAGKMRIVGISRDTMTEMKTYDYYGNYIGDSKNHLGLAYAFGDGGEGSCKLMMDAVSRLFYELPIHGYCSVNLNAIEKLNNAVGGVHVTMPEDMSLGLNSYKKGENVLLTGAEAEGFVRHRNTEEAGSNNKRMERQKQYAVSFLKAATAALKKDITLVSNLYQDLSDEMVTSLTVDQAVYLGTELTSMSLSLEEIRMLEGTTKQGQIYEEFYVDDEALQDLIIDMFYTEVG